MNKQDTRSWHVRFTEATAFALFATLFLFCLGPAKAEVPEHVYAENDVCLLRENGSWFIAKFQTFVQVTDVSIAYDKDDKEKRPQSRPIPRMMLAGSKSYRENTLMMLLDVLQHPFSSEQQARAWKDKEGWDKGEWQRNLLREVGNVMRIDAVAAKQSSPQQK